MATLVQYLSDFHLPREFDVSNESDFALILRRCNVDETHPLSIRATQAKLFFESISDFNHLGKLSDIERNDILATYWQSSPQHQQQLSRRIHLMAKQSLNDQMTFNRNSDKQSALRAGLDIINNAFSIDSTRHFRLTLTIANALNGDVTQEKLWHIRSSAISYQDPSRFEQLGAYLRKLLGLLIRLFNAEKGNAYITQAHATLYGRKTINSFVSDYSNLLAATPTKVN